MDTLDDSGPATARTTVPTWYWVVAVLALLWTLMGCYSYVTQVSMDAADLAALSPAEQDMYNAMPTWLWGLFAIAVWSSLGGAIALLLRKAWAYPLFLISLVAVVVQFGWIFIATDTLATMGASSTYFPLFIILMAALLTWFSETARRRGWIG